MCMQSASSIVNNRYISYIDRCSPQQMWDEQLPLAAPTQQPEGVVCERSCWKWSAAFMLSTPLPTDARQSDTHTAAILNAASLSSPCTCIIPHWFVYHAGWAQRIHNLRTLVRLYRD